MRIRHIFSVVVLVTLFSVGLASASDPDSDGNPSSTSGNRAPVDRTGQTTCYDASHNETPCPATGLPGQDGELQAGVAWPTPRFTDNGDGTVTDNLTGLVWLKWANCDAVVGGVRGGANSWGDALTFSRNLSAGHCGLTDDSIVGQWRLPNVKELRSLIHHGFYDPALPDTDGTGGWTEGDPFAGVKSDYGDHYWSSTTVTDDAANAWSVRMLWGEGVVISKTVELHVWPVRDTSAVSITYRAPVEKTGQTTCYDASHNETPCPAPGLAGQDGELQKGVAWPTPRFTDNGDYTVTDNLTGLIWLKNANCDAVVGGVTGGANSWKDALMFSRNLSSGHCGLTDDSIAGEWRLPDVRELYSLVDFSRRRPALPGGHPFDNVQLDYYWSSTTGVGVTTDTTRYAWSVNMLNGAVDGEVKDEEKRYVWPVRGHRVFLPMILKNSNG